MKSICQLIKESCNRVVQKAEHVKINKEKLNQYANELVKSSKDLQYIDWAENDFHYFNENNQDSVIDYIFILDSLNFCFWPKPEWEYDTLATSLKNIILKDSKAFKPVNLLKLDFETFKATVFLGQDFPQIEERFRLIQEIAASCIKYYNGEFSNIIKASNNSAEEVIQ